MGSERQSELLELLVKVLEAERRLSFQDLAVFGGFARFLAPRLKELADRGAGLPEVGHEPAEARIERYAELDPRARSELVEALRTWAAAALEAGWEPAQVPDRIPESGPRAEPSGEDEDRDGPDPDTEHHPDFELLPPAPPEPVPMQARPAAPTPVPRPESRGPSSRDGSEPVQFLKGVGPRRSQLLARLGLEIRRDLLFHVPLRYEDRTRPRRIAEAIAGQDATVVALVRSARTVPARRGPARYEAVLEDGSGRIEAVWFGQGFLQKVLPPGTRALFHGKVGDHRGRRQFAGPEFEVLEPGEEPSLGLVPIYPLTEGIHQRWLRGLIGAAVEDLAGTMLDDLPEELRRRRGLPDLAAALRGLHFPSDREAAEAARTRLAFEELFVLQCALAIRQAREQADDPAACVVPKGDLVARFKASLPFRFTGAQDRAEARILAALSAPRPMAMLLQGDVGSGKTVLALAALLSAIDAGMQGALMAPTEILAEQHHRVATRLAAPLGIVPELYLGGMTPARRRDARGRIASGEARLVIGTHALIEPDVAFARLGLVVIDEQHRFGVVQRARLRDKLGRPNLLVMTATPIPRTLSLTAYGDLDLVLLDEMPPGRNPVKTRWVRPSGLEKVWSAISAEISSGGRAYVVCPVIEESETLEAEAAEALAAELAAGPLSAHRVGLLHGRLKDADKDLTMDRFRSGDLDVLVATTVIEVGVDVPEATMMVILNAERFGLAQLHQLRGRVGRGQKASTCWLVSDGRGEETRQRLKVMVGTESGFAVAEADLRIRGPGEAFGTRQSGLPELRFANVVEDVALIEAARDEARAMVAGDPELAGPGRERLRATVDARLERFSAFQH